MTKNGHAAFCKKFGGGKIPYNCGPMLAALTVLSVPRPGVVRAIKLFSTSWRMTNTTCVDHVIGKFDWLPTKSVPSGAVVHRKLLMIGDPV